MNKPKKELVEGKMFFIFLSLFFCHCVFDAVKPAVLVYICQPVGFNLKMLTSLALKMICCGIEQPSPFALPCDVNRYA